MTNTSLNATDFHLLHYFAVVAEENSLRRAAERLFMAQPPLSRHIKRLEERLGLTLFIRHTKGLTLTEDGARVLENIRPLLRLQAKTFQQLDALAKPLEKVFALGFTTAFEQGIFSAMEAHLRERHGKSLRVTRNSSPKLARDVRKGRLDAALVALPLDAPGLTVTPVAHAEPLFRRVGPKPKARACRCKNSTADPCFGFGGRAIRPFSISHAAFLPMRAMRLCFWKNRPNTTCCWPALPPVKAWDCCLPPLRLSGATALFLSRWKKGRCCGCGWGWLPYRMRGTL